MDRLPVFVEFLGRHALPLLEEGRDLEILLIVWHFVA